MVSDAGGEESEDPLGQGRERDADGDERDLAATRRDAVGDRRDLAGAARDVSSDARDVTASRRDVAADARDRAAEARDSAATPAPDGAYAAARTEAASDRSHAAQDRHAGALDRSTAEHDRTTGLADREAGEAERAGSERDRADASTDRVAAEGDRAAAAIDALTGVRSRTAGLAEIAREMARSERTSLPLTLLYFDVDHLKAINDAGGHAAGDSALVAVVETVRAVLRTYDLMVRLGGDEFLCALAGLDEAGARSRVAAITTALSDAPGTPSATFGVAQMRRGESPARLIERADADMYAQRDLERSTGH